MKRLFLVLLMAYGTCLTAQPATEPNADNKPELSKEQFMLKSKKDKTAAWLLLGAGIGITMTGVIVIANEYSDILISSFSGEPKYNSSTADVLFVIGVSSMAGSIPLFISSGKNRRRANAASVSIDVKKQYQIQLGSVKPIHYPALSIKLPL